MFVRSTPRVGGRAPLEGKKPIVTASISPVFNNGEIWYAWVDYNGSTDMLEVRVSMGQDRPDTPTVMTTVDLPAVLGQTDAFVGFTSGTGAGANDHDIRSWRFIPAFQPIGSGLGVPALQPLGLLVLVLVLLFGTGWIVRRRRQDSSSA